MESLKQFWATNQEVKEKNNNMLQRDKQPKSKKGSRLSKVGISEVLVHNNNIKSDNELFAKVCEQKDDSKKDISILLFPRYSDVNNEYIIMTWKSILATTW